METTVLHKNCKICRQVCKNAIKFAQPDKLTLQNCNSISQAEQGKEKRLNTLDGKSRGGVYYCLVAKIFVRRFNRLRSRLESCCWDSCTTMFYYEAEYRIELPLPRLCFLSGPLPSVVCRPVHNGCKNLNWRILHSTNWNFKLYLNV